MRFSKEEDFSDWGHRLKIHGLDLRHIPSVDIFCNFIEKQYDRLDILINNAAQTVRRPAGFYQHLMHNEETAFEELPAFAKQLLKDHNFCVNQLHALSQSTSEGENNNLSVAWHGPEPGIGLSSSAKLSQIPYSFDNSLCPAEAVSYTHLRAHET